MGKPESMTHKVVQKSSKTPPEVVSRSASRETLSACEVGGAKEVVGDTLETSSTADAALVGDAAECRVADSQCAACLEKPWQLRTLLVLLAPLAFFVTSLACLYRSMPPLSEAERSALVGAFVPPHSVQDVQLLTSMLRVYTEAHPLRATLCYVLLYLCMQTYAVPGTILLTLASGALFGAARGFALVQLCAVAGATLCYGLSHAVGRAIAHRLWPARVHAFRDEVAKRKGYMLNYVLFLRMTYFLPATFINLAAPIVDVPLPAFVLGTLLGTAANNFVACRAGMTLSGVSSLAELTDVRMITLLFALACVVVAPTFVRAPTMLAAGRAAPIAAKAS